MSDCFKTRARPVGDARTMSLETQHISVSIARSATDVYAYASNPRNLPESEHRQTPRASRFWDEATPATQVAPGFNAGAERSRPAPLTMRMPVRTRTAPTAKDRSASSFSTKTPALTPNRGVMNEKTDRLEAR